MKLPRRLLTLFRRRKLETEMAEEMRLHMELLAEGHRAAGMSADEASYAARREFGGVEQLKEQVREQRGWTWLESVLGDARFAWRTLAKTPGFSLLAIGVLALAIGANVTVVNLFQTLLFAPPGYGRPNEIFRVVQHEVTNPRSEQGWTYERYREARDPNGVFSGMLAHQALAVGLVDSNDTRRAMAALVSANFFSVLGVAPEAGRTFQPAEEIPGDRARVAIVSHAFAQKHRFDQGFIGSVVEMNGRKFTIVGIMPEGFTGTMNLFATEIWLPLGDNDIAVPATANTSPRATGQTALRLTVLGRLKPGVSREAAESALRALAQTMDSGVPAGQPRHTFRLEKPSRFATADNDRGILVIGGLFLAMSGVVLIVACLNLASFLLARGATRQREIAIRLAVGGSRARIVRQLLTEGFVLALLGGGLGTLVATWSSDLLVAWLGARVPAALAWSARPQPGLLLAALGFCVFGTLVFALGPALRLSRSGAVSLSSTQQFAFAANRRRRWLPRNPLIIAQIALALALVATAGLFIRGAKLAAQAETGLRASTNFLVEADAGLAGRTPDQAREVYERVVARFASLPGVVGSSVATDVPLSGQDFEIKTHRVGSPTNGAANSDAPGKTISAKTNSIGSDYFTTAGLPVLKGRAFATTETNRVDGPRVVVINAVLARELWPEGDEIGQQLVIEREADEASAVASAAGTEIFEVVGVVPSTRHVLYEKKPEPEVYLPLARGFRTQVYFHVKYAALPAGTEEGTAAVLRRALQETDPTLPVLSVESFAHHLDDNVQIWSTRAAATLFTVFGGLSLFIAVVGVYGLVAHAVAARTKEIGIRMALGAQPATVRRMIWRQNATTVAIGLAVGVLLALAAGKAVSALLYGVGAKDPMTFALAFALLSVAGLAACWWPARRATKVDPVIALRAE